MILLLLFVPLAAGAVESGNEVLLNQDETETNVTQAESLARWNSFKTEYGKSYDVIEDAKHRRRFETVLEMIKTHNERYRAGLASFTMAVNRFADLDYYYERTTMTRTAIVVDHKFAPPMDSALPPLAKHVDANEEMDWRKRGVVTAVRDQLCGGACACGSCWAQAAVGLIEGHHAIETGHLVELSVQQLVDCTGRPSGCSGGIPYRALEYAARHGVASEEAYPYTGQDGECRYNASDAAARIGLIQSIYGDEDEISRIISTQGPVLAFIHYGVETFAFYNQGVYFDPVCRTAYGQTDHVILITGIGEDPEFGPFYWIKNSFGPAWGEDGFMRMARGTNACGIANNVIYLEPERGDGSSSTSSSTTTTSTTSTTSTASMTSTTSTTSPTIEVSSTVSLIEEDQSAVSSSSLFSHSPLMLLSLFIVLLTSLRH